jgi:hypothetical protein
LTVLHPQHKLAYFKTQEWEEVWVETAYNLVCDEFNHLNASSADLDDSDEDDNASDGATDNVRTFYFVFLFLF